MYISLSSPRSSFESNDDCIAKPVDSAIGSRNRAARDYSGAPRCRRQ